MKPAVNLLTLVAGLSILYYDLILTLPDEISNMWSLKGRLGRTLHAAYVVDRYGAAATTILYLCVCTYPRFFQPRTVIAEHNSFFSCGGLLCKMGKSLRRLHSLSPNAEIYSKRLPHGLLMS